MQRLRSNSGRLSVLHPPRPSHCLSSRFGHSTKRTHFHCRFAAVDGPLERVAPFRRGGRYTFCGLAAAMLAGEAQLVALPRLLAWLVGRQGAPEGGFQGRTNKLVDGCYSFWQGGTARLLQRLMPQLAAQAGDTWRGPGSGGEQGRWGETGAGVEGGGKGESGDEQGVRREQDGSSEIERYGEGQSTEQGQGRGDEAEGPSRGAAEKMDMSSTAGASVRAARTGEGQTAVDEAAGTVRDEPPGASGRSAREWARGEAGQAGPGGEPESAESSEYETDDEDGGPGGERLPTAAELFPAEPLAEPHGGGAVHLVIEEEEAAGPRPAAPRGGEGEGAEDARVSEGHGDTGGLGEALLNARALQAYILVCCQQADGGLRDKPGK